MSKTTRIAFIVFLILALVFSIFLSALRYISLNEFETDVDYYPADALLPSVLHYLLFAVVLIYLIVGLFLRDKIYLSSNREGLSFYFGSALLGTSLATYALFSLPSFFGSSNQTINASISAFLLLSIIFSLVGVFFCIHNCLFPDAEQEKRMFLGLSIPLFAVLYVLYLYFETSAPINAPNKLLDQFTFVFTALYFVYELRILVKTPRYAAQSALGMITMIFAAVNGFPSLLYMIVHQEPLSQNAGHDILMIAVFTYILINLVRIASSETEEQNKILELLTEAEHPSIALDRRDAPTNDQLDELQLTFDHVMEETVEDSNLSEQDSQNSNFSADTFNNENDVFANIVPQESLLTTDKEIDTTDFISENIDA